ncbi:MAG: elongation factor G [Thermotogae bacterium]|nr:elongation factor G [Thermotogota bacterium]
MGEVGGVANRKNFAIVGHNGSGKTMLVEAMLYNAKVIEKMGSVDQGNSIMDFDEFEIERKASLTSSLATFDYSGNRLTLIDNPGFGDFISDVITSIAVCENLVSVINAVAGVEVQTERTWRIAEQYKRPAMFFVNQMDKERADFDSSIQSIREAFEKRVTPIAIPIGAGETFSGIVDLIKLKAYKYSTDGSGNKDEIEIPADIKSKAEELRTSLIEDIVETDEELMEKYLEGEEIDSDTLLSALKKAYIAGDFVPVFCGSAVKNMGVDVFLEYLSKLGASILDIEPLKAKLMEGDAEVELKPTEEEPFVGLIFKAVVDPFVGKISYIKVLSGVLSTGDSFVNTRTNTTEKISHIYTVVGKKQNEIEKAIPGDIIALTKLKESAVGDTICHKDRKVIIDIFEFPEPMISKSVHPKSKSDIDKISNGLSRIAESDPTFRWEFDPETGETVISGVGGMHLDVIVERLKRIFGVDVEVGKPKIAYRETIRKKAVAEHKHKKQTGGHGQYGHVKIEMEPLPRGAGFEFVDKIVGGVIPRNYIPSVEKGIREAMKKGSLAGYPVVDVKITLFDGSYHEVDSSDISFQIAAIQAFRKGMQEADPVILEPIMEVEIFVPDDNAGDVMGEISSRRGRPLGMEPASKGFQKVKAEVPLAEMLDFSSKLSSITSGKGYFTMKFVRYEPVPQQIQEKIIAERQRELEEEKK